MNLSVIVPSRRTGLAACSRLMHAASWASDDIEVIIRDTSGDESKRKLLRRCARRNCRVVFGDPDDGNSNFHEALKLARGDFIQYVADDDGMLDRGVDAIAKAAKEASSDLSVAGIVGAYVLEQGPDSRVVSYEHIYGPDAAGRVQGYLGYQGPNMLFYSTLRRSVALETLTFIISHPFKLPFHDQIDSLLYLMAGRFLHVGRLTYILDNANWESPAACVASDLGHYALAGLDPIMRAFHWLMCGFEGASVVLSPRFGDLSREERQAIAGQWFSLMLQRFAADSFDGHGSALTIRAWDIRNRLMQDSPNFAIATVRERLCEVIALFSAEKALAYDTFWKSQGG